MKRKLIMGMAALLIAGLLAGCQAEAPQEPLRIGVMADLGGAPFVLAEELGIYDDLGLDVEIQVFRSAVERDTALQTGNLDGAMVDMLTVVFFEDAGLGMKMVAQTGGSYKMVSSPGLDREAFDALEEKSVGLSSNTVMDFVSQIVAESEGFEAQMVPVAIPQMPVRLEMLASGELAAATLPEPLASAALSGGGVLIADTDEIALYPGVFIVTGEAVSGRGGDIQALFDGYDLAIERIVEETLTPSYGILVEKVGFPEPLADVFAQPNLGPLTLPDEASFLRTLEWMQTRELTGNTYTYQDVTETGFIKE